MFQKKSLGQNFLKSERALREIVEASEIQKTDTVLEIGPGEGVLTAQILAKNPARLVAVEKDDRLIPILQEKFAEEISSEKLTLVHADIIDELEKGLEILHTQDSDQLDSTGTTKEAGVKGFKVIANIPYYITGLIMRNLFSLAVLPERIVLLVQKEVADRITDSTKNNLLRTSTTLYGQVRRVSVVPRGAFVPAPNVDSAIICISNITKPDSTTFEEAYFAITKSAFAHKRKKASKNLDGTLTLDYKQWENCFTDLGLPTNVRAEDISTEQFKTLAHTIVHKITEGR